MKLSPEKIWSIAAVVMAAAAGISAAMVLLSAAEGNTVNTILSGIAMVFFIICSIMAWTARTGIPQADKAPEEVECLRLKTPGLERKQDDMIVPKGKMPKE